MMNSKQSDSSNPDSEEDMARPKASQSTRKICVENTSETSNIDNPIANFQAQAKFKRYPQLEHEPGTSSQKLGNEDSKKRKRKKKKKKKKKKENTGSDGPGKDYDEGTSYCTLVVKMLGWSRIGMHHFVM